MPKRSLPFAFLLLALSSNSWAAPEQWVEVSSPHFDVFTNAGEKQGRHVLDQFERMRWVFRTLFPTVNGDPPAPMVVMAVKSRRDFQSLEPEAYLAKGQLDLAGYFLRAPDTDYILVRLDAEQDQHPFATVYHEYTHSQFAKGNTPIPLWLNEGLAQFFENTTMRDKNVVLGEISTNEILYLRQTSLIPLPVLFAVDQKSPYYHQEQKGSAFYAESWALTHYLLVEDRAHKTNRVGEYLRRMERHEDPVVAAGKSFGDLKKLSGELESYLQQTMYQTFILNSAAAPLDEASYKVKALAEAEANGERAEVMAAVGRKKDAQGVVDDLLKQDANSVKAREVLATMAFREGNIVEARKQYGEAVKLGSQNYLDYFYFATFSRYGGDAESADIEKGLSEAIRLNPGFAPAYDRLAMEYMTRGDRLDEAYKLAVKAIELDPSNFSYRMDAVTVLSAMGNFADAEKVLNALAKMTVNPEQEAEVGRRLAEMKQMQTVGRPAGTVKYVQPGTAPAGEPGGVVDVAPAGNQGQVVEVAKETPPKHPTEPATGPKHSMEGVIGGVTCSYPYVIEFRVEGAGKTVTVYSNDYSNLDVTAAGSTGLEGGVDPCRDFAGRTAWVEYRESSDKTVDGQVTAVEIRK
jgi:tetratricopeptide (TPR) repeat protein